MGTKLGTVRKNYFRFSGVNRSPQASHSISPILDGSISIPHLGANGVHAGKNFLKVDLLSGREGSAYISA